MSAKVINSYAQHVIIESGRSANHVELLQKIQGIHRGSIHGIRYKRVPLGLVEILDIAFMDLSMVRMTIFVGTGGTTRMSLKLLDDKEN
jgi:hypothetical protein